MACILSYKHFISGNPFFNIIFLVVAFIAYLIIIIPLSVFWFLTWPILLIHIISIPIAFIVIMFDKLFWDSDNKLVLFPLNVFMFPLLYFVGRILRLFGNAIYIGPFYSKIVLEE